MGIDTYDYYYINTKAGNEENIIKTLEKNNTSLNELNTEDRSKKKEEIQILNSTINDYKRENAIFNQNIII